VTGYGLDSQGSIPGRGKRFFSISTASRPALGLTQPPIQWVLGVLSLEVKCPGHEADPSLHLVLRLVEVELYLHSPYVFIAWSLIN
jgi:hypothetical protein